jgi:hypothetical protein
MQSEPTLFKQGLTTRCAEFARDVTIKRERDDTEQDRGDSEGGR